jgi:hypothetical protein
MLVAVVLILVAVGTLAALALLQVGRGGERGAQVAARFAALHSAFLQYVAANGRLPCPADPEADTGTAVPPTAGACTHGEGTVPWQTVGARRDDAIDPWGYKISYRVYSPVANGLTRTDGASMVDCDTSDSGPLDTGTALCATSPRDTGPLSFLAGKGLPINDLGVAITDAAYVLISHGPTGLGAYSAGFDPATLKSARRDMPAAGGSERSNTQASGPFVIKAFSPAGTDASSIDHFDDYVSYRSVEALIRAAGRYARNWPEDAASAGRSVTLSQAAVTAAVGSSVTSDTSVGQVSVTFTGVVTTQGRNTSGGTSEISYYESGGMSGIGVAGGASSLIQSSADEFVRLVFEESFTKFGITLNDFGTVVPFKERVELRFYLGDTQVAAKIGKGCNFDGGQASFEVDIGPQLFDTVDVTPLTSEHDTDPAQSGITAFWIGEIKACVPADTSCTTSGLACPLS